MPLKSILVPLNGTDSDLVALRAGIAVARDFQAHLRGMFIRLDPRDAIPMLGEGMSGAMVDEIMRAAEGETSNHRASGRRHFDAVLTDSGVVLGDRPGVAGASASWSEVTGRVEDVVPAEGRTTDLLVFAHDRLDRDMQAQATIETALFGTGRPLLLAPASLPERIGSHVVIAWNGNREATRALVGAMPFLLAADAVTILTAETQVTQASAGQRLLDYLGWQGVSADLQVLSPASGQAVGVALTEKAHSLGGTLLVMGGYGHSRMRELILGGVTRHVITKAELPVLMAH